MTIQKIEMLECTCENEKCGWCWITRLKDKIPNICPKCKNKTWNKSSTQQNVT